jgi:lactate dehydrogenase-like 2-hydroxyacid dehydrogenase
VKAELPMTEHRILVTRRPPGRTLEMLAGAGQLDLWAEDREMPAAVLRDRIARATGLYCMLTDAVDRDLLEAAPALKAVSQMAVGVDNVDLGACTDLGIPVGHTPDVLTDTVADTAMGLLIAGARRFREGVDYVRSGEWRRWEPELLWGNDVHGSVLGIVGLGRVGRAVAQRARGFDMRILYAGRRRLGAREELGAEYVALSELLERSDHVVISVALAADTTGLIDAAALARMKSTATLVNVSRGATVDTAALVRALRSGEIAAAALDVTDPEPLPPDHELLALANCLVIPHLGSSTARTRIAMAELAAENLIAGLGDVRMPACANPEVYDG